MVSWLNSYRCLLQKSHHIFISLVFLPPIPHSRAQRPFHEPLFSVAADPPNWGSNASFHFFSIRNYVGQVRDRAPVGLTCVRRPRGGWEAPRRRRQSTAEGAEARAAASFSSRFFSWWCRCRCGDEDFFVVGCFVQATLDVVFVIKTLLFVAGWRLQMLSFHLCWITAQCFWFLREQADVCKCCCYCK